jgi:hypothetical protein
MSKTFDEVLDFAAQAVERHGRFSSIIEESIFFDNMIKSQGIDPDFNELTDIEDETVESLLEHRSNEVKLRKELFNQLNGEQIELAVQFIREHRIPEKHMSLPEHINFAFIRDNVLRCASPGSQKDYESSSDESDDSLPVKQASPVKLVHRKQVAVPDNPEKMVYSIKTLMSLCPSHLGVARERAGLQKTVYRFDPIIPNRVFKRRWFFSKGVLPKGVPKVPVIIHGNDLIPMQGKGIAPYKPPFGGKPITRPETRPNKSTKKNSKEFRALKPKVPPMAHHTKYWYFLRKRGTYETSRHHPYGDEYEAYASDPG